MAEGNLKKTPLHGWHREHGGKMVEFGGWEMPVQYETGILKEHLATRKFGGLFDVSHMGRIRLKGEQRIAFLQHVLSSNVEALEPWQAQYTLLPDPKGGVVDDAYLYRFGESEYILVVNASNRETDLVHLRAHASRFPGVVLDDQTHELAMIAFQGPLSRDVLEESIEAGSLPEPAHNSLSEMKLCGARVLVSRTGYTGEPIGFELFVPAESAEKILSQLYEKGRARGVLPIGLGARDTLRLEAAMPLYGHEFGADPKGGEIPAFSAPLARVAVSLSGRKGDFVGREALARQFQEDQRILTRTYQPTPVLRRRCRPVALLDQGVARKGDLVFSGDREVGVVTSGTVIPYWRFEGEGATMRITDETGKRPIALALLDAELPPDQELDLVVRNRRLRSMIVRYHGRSEAPPYFRSIPAPSGMRGQTGSLVCPRIPLVEVLLRKGLENHRWRQRRCVNLIPSEMTPSPLVRLVQVSDPAGRYAEHKKVLAAFDQEVFYYQGTEFISWVEERLAEEMGRYLGCSQVESRVISGQMANLAVFGALTDYKNRTDRRREPERLSLVLNHHIGRGGHLSSQPMGALRDYVARDPVTERYAVVNFPVQSGNAYRIDLGRTAELLERANPELIIFGKSMVLHPEPVAEVRKLVEGKSPRPLLMYDMAHVLGLVGPHFQQPFKEGADLVTGSTHKTFFGPQRGVIGSNFGADSPRHALWKAIERRAFPGLVSNHHLGTLVGLLLATLEMNAFKDAYQPQVLANAKAFARALKAQGLDVEGDPAVGYTETHQVLDNVGHAQGCEIAKRLERNNIIVNYQAIPSDEGFTASSGLRLGVSEMTRFGMKEKDFAEFAALFADCVRNDAAVGERVAGLRERFRSLGYCFTGAVVEELRKELLGELGG